MLHNWITRKYSWCLFPLLFLLIVFASAQIHLRWDLTREQRYSLSAPTKQLLTQVDQPINVQLFLTGDLTPEYQKLSDATEELLNDFRSLSHNNIHYSVVPLGEGMDDSTKAMLYDSLSRQGVVFENTENFSENSGKQVSQLIIPSALISIEGKEPIAVDLRSSRTVFKKYNVLSDAEAQPDKEGTLNAAEALLEYKFSNAIDKLTRKKTPSIGYLVGNGEPIDLTVNDLGESLRKDYHLGVIDLTASYPNPKDVDALLIVKPSKPFSDMDKLKLDQFVMHGGKILWFVDKLYAELDSLMRSHADFVAYDRNLNIDDILFKYGVRINGDLLQDLNCAKLPIVIGYNPDKSPRMQRMPWPYYPFLTSVNDNPITKNMDRVIPIFPSTIDTVAAEGIKKTILLASDTNSRVLTSPAIVSLNSWQNDVDFKSFNKAHLPVAVLLEGQFSSLFSNRVTQEWQDSIEMHFQEPFQTKSPAAGKQIVVSNAGIVTNTVMKTQGPLGMGMLPFDNYRFANKDFLMNSVDYLIGTNDLFIARNKDFVLRLLDKQKVSENKGFWQMINIVLPILLVVLFGFIFNQVRKKKYHL